MIYHLDILTGGPRHRVYTVRVVPEGHLEIAQRFNVGYRQRKTH